MIRSAQWDATKMIVSESARVRARASETVPKSVVSGKERAAMGGDAGREYEQRRLLKHQAIAWSGAGAEVAFVERAPEEVQL